MLAAGPGGSGVSEATVDGQISDENASGLAIVSPRYGYFGMGQFLFWPDRKKFVRWFMDQFTETLARYPHATRIDFIGHSNGTYLLKGALDDYDMIGFSRVVFAGSVVPRDFHWDELLAKERIDKVRNYVGTSDMVVGLFPRLFELYGLRKLNDMGSAGFNGFDAFPPNNPGGSTNFANVTIPGGHSAFHLVADQIASFVMNDQEPAGTPDLAAPSCIWKFVSRYAFWIVWLGIAWAIVFPGVQVARAAGVYAWVPVVAYGALVFLLLKRL